MPEMASASEDHSNTMFVCSSNHFLIAHTAPGLDYTFGACCNYYIQTIPKWKEGITRNSRAFQAKTSMLSLNAGNPRRINATHLAGTNS
jgi:hypothetical protein